MGGFELNKMLAAVLLALLVGAISTELSEVLVKVEYPDKNVYLAEGSSSSAVGEASQSAPKNEIEPIASYMANANVDAGKSVARKCLQCHTFENGGKHKIGPNLWDIMDNDIASKDGYAYSKAMKKIEGNWDDEKMNHFLFKPKSFVKGTKMTFAGLKKPEDRANLIAYLRSLK